MNRCILFLSETKVDQLFRNGNRLITDIRMKPARILMEDLAIEVPLRV